MNRVEVGNRLRTFMLEKFGKLKTGAEKLEMSPSSLQMYLMGKRLPGAEIISKLKSLGCDIEWLLLFKDDPYPAGSSDGNSIQYTGVKDKIIVTQAEKIQELEEEIKRLKRGK